MTSTWFITGASRGFGRELTEQLLARGDRIAAPLRKPEQLGHWPSRGSRAGRFPYAATLAAIGLVLFPAAPASAKFSVFPTVIDLHAKPGRAAVGTFNVRLEGERGRRFSVAVQDLVQQPDGSFAVARPTRSEFSASHWTAVTPRKFAGAPNRVQPIEYTVLVPGKAEPGDHLTSLTVSRLAPRGRSTTAPLEAISVRLAVRVEGEVKRGAEISSLDAPRIAAGNPVTVSAAIRNSGNVRLDFDRQNKGLLVILDGSERKDSLPLTGTLYPGEQRPFELSWDDAPLFGEFRAVASVEVGHKVIRDSTSILVIPWRQIGALVLIAVAALVLAVGRSRRRSRST